MYEELVDKCNKILSDRNIPEVEVDLDTTMELLSYTDCNKEVRIGVLARAMHDTGVRDLNHSVMHEMVHILMENFPPSPNQKRIFGTPEDWEEEQKFSKMFALDSMCYATRYGMTHPDEDFVETVTAILLGEDVPDNVVVDTKVATAEEWLNSLR